MRPGPLAASGTGFPAVEGLAYGGDYNPEQWPPSIQLEDVELMAQAGVNLVSVAIFSWATLEPREGEYDFRWLDEVLDRLHEAGVRVALATATASPPPWLTRTHPEVLPQRADGTVLHQGGRQAYAVASPVFRDYAVRMTRVMAERYAAHPALVLWHVDNELGCHVPHDHSDAAAVAFRRWLEARYGTVDALNVAWGNRADVCQPRSAAGLRPLLLRRAARALPSSARRAARGHPRPTGRAGCRSRCSTRSAAWPRSCRSPRTRCY